MAKFTKEIVDDIIAMSGKVIAEPIEWKKDKVRPSRKKFEVRVLIEDSPVNGTFRLVGTASLHKYSFTLLHQSNTVLRRISAPTNWHRDPLSRERVDPHHKHQWYSEDIAEAHVYIPNDIDWSNNHTVLTTFLAECNIISLFDIPEPMFQSTIQG